MGIVNSTGCSSVWGATFPYNPYPFPWSNHLFQDSPSIALGLFEGHMRKMGEGFKAIRMARLELERGYNAAEHGEALTYFGWKDFTDEEWLLCPPVVAVGGDGAMYDIGFQNLSRALMSGHPVKIMVLDTQVYSNTGGQSCTSGFIGQVADMAPYGKVGKGKTEIRKEMGLIGMAHRTSFVLNGAAGNLTHLLEGFIDGLNARHPALFNIYTSCQPEHGIGDEMSTHQSRMAVESRAYPLFRFDPDAGTSFEECCSIEGNPNIDQDWISWTLKYTDEKGEPAEMNVPFTFADFAMTEGRFRKHFRKAPPETWNDAMIPMAEFLDMDEDARIGHFPYVWGVDAKNRLMRVLVSQELVISCEERRAFWTQLRGICGHLNRSTSRRCAIRPRPKWHRSSPAACSPWPAAMRERSRPSRAATATAATARGSRQQRRRQGFGQRRGDRLGTCLGRNPGMHRLRRVHHHQPEDLQVQRREEGRGDRSQGAAPIRTSSRPPRSAPPAASTRARPGTRQRPGWRSCSSGLRSTNRSG